jgi:signal peptidase I
MSVRGRSRRRLIGNLAFGVVFVGALTAWFLTLRPGSLGGPASYVMVRGVSMEPTYHDGDLVITRQRPSYHVDDIVAYAIPAGDVGGGLTVIHRIVGGSPEMGFTTQGDNNGEADPWQPSLGQIKGTTWLVLPRAGAIMLFLRAPIPLASLAASIAVGMVVYRRGDRPSGRRRRHSVDPETSEGELRPGTVAADA